MLTGEIVEKKTFAPVTIQITIDSQDDLDKLTSLTNHAWLSNVFENIHELTDVLKKAGGDQNIYLDRFTENFQKRCR